MSTKCVIADRMDLMKRYLDGKDALSNDEREILLFSLYIESKERKGLAYEAIKQMGVFVEPPKPAPATPAATPMVGKHLPRVSTDGRLSCSCGFTIGTIDTSANVRKVTEACAYLFAGHVAAFQPAAAQPQRESEQLREALKNSMVALDDWLNIHAPDLCDEQRVKEARQRVNERGTIRYIGTVQDRNRAALSPQTDSQEPR